MYIVYELNVDREDKSLTVLGLRLDSYYIGVVILDLSIYRDRDVFINVDKTTIIGIIAVIVVITITIRRGLVSILEPVVDIGIIY